MEPEGKKLRMNRPVIFSETPPFPQNMLMELTNCCNHECVFCGYKNMKRKKIVCDKARMLDLMRQAYENGTREIGFYMIGEPFLCKDLPEYVEAAHDLGFEYIYLTTNGVLATLERMKELIKKGLCSIKLSVNGATRATYAAVHGKDDFDVLKSNIEQLNEYVTRENIDFPIFISFIKNELNKDDIDLLYHEFTNIVDRIYVFDCCNQAAGMADMISRGVVTKESLKPGSTCPCEMIFNRIHITCEGYLNACCSDVEGYLSAVDLRDFTLAEAWNSEKMVELRRRHLNNELGHTLCNSCINNIEDTIVPINADLVP